MANGENNVKRRKNEPILSHVSCVVTYQYFSEIVGVCCDSLKLSYFSN